MQCYYAPASRNFLVLVMTCKQRCSLLCPLGGQAGRHLGWCPQHNPGTHKLLLTFNSLSWVGMAHPRAKQEVKSSKTAEYMTEGGWGHGELESAALLKAGPSQLLPRSIVGAYS